MCSIGSIVGPPLFNIFINDIIMSSVKFNFILYADDTTHSRLNQLVKPQLIYNPQSEMSYKRYVNGWTFSTCLRK